MIMFDLDKATLASINNALVNAMGEDVKVQIKKGDQSVVFSAQRIVTIYHDKANDDEESLLVSLEHGIRVMISREGDEYSLYVYNTAGAGRA